MSSSAEVLQRAIQAARAGRKTEARDLLIDLVEVEPRNEMAWMWLSGLVDSLEDRIIACENVLTINPANEKVRTYLADLQRQYMSFLAEKNSKEAIDLFNQAKAYEERKDLNTALQLAMQAVEKCEDYEEAWLMIGTISPDMNQQFAALEKAAKLNPSNTKTASALKQIRYLKTNPMDVAARLEEAGKFEEALKIYEVQAAVTKDLKEFDRIYNKIMRIEGLR
ncbi:MAG TPA: hypothetical protein VLE49_10930, partial [Anaerolineales bacterium]|nr:hypothetical protein [Anaerolineales bacterium]